MSVRRAMLCARCLSRGIAGGIVRPISPSQVTQTRLLSTSTPRPTDNSSSAKLESLREAAKKRAWYLDDSEATPAPPKPLATPKPRFTTFDPLSTLPNPEPALPPRPLPPNAPQHFKALHAFLTTSELLDPPSVVFLHTPSSTSVRRDEEELGIGGTGATWEWVIVAVVKGRGKGVVGRAERAVRIWLKDNPIPQFTTSASPRRMPRVEAETDWSLVPIGQSRACVNLFTEEGRDRWDLEDLFAAQ